MRALRDTHNTIIIFLRCKKHLYFLIINYQCDYYRRDKKSIKRLQINNINSDETISHTRTSQFTQSKLVLLRSKLTIERYHALSHER